MSIEQVMRTLFIADSAKVGIEMTHNDAHDLRQILTDCQTRIASLESENAALRERTRWIPVSERLPEDGKNVLIAVKSDFALQRYANN